MTKLEMFNWVLRQLGGPTRNIELTEDQLNDALDFALLETKTWFTEHHYITIDLASGQSAIHLPSLYDPDENGQRPQFLDVVDIIKIPQDMINSSQSMDPFNSNFRVGGFGGGFMGIGIGSNYYSQITNNNVHQVISQFARQRNELFYAKLAQLIWQRTAGQINPDINFEFHKDDQILYLGIGYPPSTTITIEFIPLLTKWEEITDDRYLRAAQDLALGQALTLQARFTGKYSISNAPSRINYGEIRAEGRDLINQAKIELRRISHNFVIVE